MAGVRTAMDTDGNQRGSDWTLNTGGRLSKETVQSLSLGLLGPDRIKL